MSEQPIEAQAPQPSAQEEARQAILQVIATIPAGQACSYGEVARRAGQSGKARYVGYILKNLPNDSTIPWHRVMTAAGKIAFKAGSERYQAQVAKLNAEGIYPKNGRFKVDIDSPLSPLSQQR